MDPNEHSNSIDHGTSDGNSDTIQFHLNSTEAKWLKRQEQFFSDALVGVLTGALCEWIERNPNRVVDSLTVRHILHGALEEFISRHRDEFL